MSMAAASGPAVAVPIAAHAGVDTRGLPERIAIFSGKPLVSTPAWAATGMATAGPLVDAMLMATSSLR